MYYVYFILLDKKDIYKGSTDDLNRRWLEHTKGKVKSTKRFKLKQLLGYKAYILRNDASRREKFIKTTEGRNLLNKQYRDIIDKFKKN